MGRLFAIARNAFTETIRQPIYGVLILAAFGVLVLSLPLSGWTMGRGAAEYAQTDQQMMTNLGLGTLLTTQLFIAAFSAAGVFSREIEDRTILTIVAKPVSRPMIVGGKFAGVAAALVVAYYLCALVLLMTVRHKVMPRASDPYDWPVIVLGCSAVGAAVIAALFCNYFFSWHFATGAVGFGAAGLTIAMGLIAFIGKGWTAVPFGQGIPTDLLVAMLLMLLAVLVVTAVAIAASTRLGQLMTLLVCLGFFVAGSAVHAVLRAPAEGNLLARAAYFLCPNLSLFYALDALTQRRPIPMSYVGLAAAYAACHVTAILAIGMALFQRRELEPPGASAAPRFVSLLAWAGRAAAVACVLLAAGLPVARGWAAEIGLRAALVAAGAGAWLLWGAFGRGATWTYFAVGAMALGATGVCLTDLATSRALLGLSRPALLAGAIVSGVAAGIIVLPKTRHYFGFVPKASKRPEGLSITRR